jgi:MFS transporter, MFS domain-containing protein family, molybdate-anion transporter
MSDYGCGPSPRDCSLGEGASQLERWVPTPPRDGAIACVREIPKTHTKRDMEGFYVGTFAALAVACVLLEVRKQQRQGASDAQHKVTPAFMAFRNNYLVVYSLMMAGDWLQGPYVYALYKHYGYSTGDIGKLFIAGFGSSMIFGTIVGSLADRYGRKIAGLTYVATYIASCITKHWSDYGVLMLGRFFGGIATSLLFTAFESWLVSEHFSRNYDPEWLNGTFSKAIFIGNGVVSIVAGLLANYLVTDMDFGPVAPFDAAATFLAVGGIIIATTWTENKGAVSENASLQASFGAAKNAIFNDKKVLYLGAMQSLFEAAMYSFVFLWTPALSPNDEDIPHGMIFATMMVACMIGSSMTARLLGNKDLRPEKYMQYVFVTAAGSLSLPIVLKVFPFPPNYAKGMPITFEGKLTLFGFLVFEAMVGIFWPSMMKMRATYVPEEVRSTVMNCFRIPLNLFVCIILYNVALFPLSFMFAMCVLFLITAAYLQRKLEILTSARGATVPQHNI